MMFLEVRIYGSFGKVRLRNLQICKFWIRVSMRLWEA